jgi:ectoine hydroxylase-related dioxygenase (phytanoyl-CoA dioxygenase family)
MDYQTKQQMKDEFKTEIAKGYITLEEIQDNSGEWVDGYLPVYYNQIVEEWQKMPSEYNDRGAQELGLHGENTIYHLMSLDLYLYYTDIFNEAIAELEEELEMAE